MACTRVPEVMASDGLKSRVSSPSLKVLLGASLRLLPARPLTRPRPGSSASRSDCSIRHSAFQWREGEWISRSHALFLALGRRCGRDWLNAGNEAAFAAYSFRPADHSLKFAVFSLFDTYATGQKAAKCAALPPTAAGGERRGQPAAMHRVWLVRCMAQVFDVKTTVFIVMPCLASSSMISFALALS